MTKLERLILIGCLCILAFFMTKCSHAEDFLVANLAAHHWNRDSVAANNLNEENYGLGLEHSNGDFIAMGGFYRNSIRRNSVYALAGWTPLHAARIKAGGIVGAVSGYASMPIKPAFAGLLSYEGQRLGLNLLLVPTVRALKAEGFAAVQVKLKF